MRPKSLLLYVLLPFLCIAGACSRKHPKPQLVVEIPPGFSGNFVLQIGVRGAAPLPMEANTCVVSIPRGGSIQTSTLLDNPNVTFRNHSEGRVWGYSQRLFTTGDGIAIGGQIEFFVGTQKEFEAEQSKKNKSGRLLNFEPLRAGA